MIEGLALFVPTWHIVLPAATWDYIVWPQKVGSRENPSMPSPYLMCPEVARWQSLNGFICEKAKALLVSFAKVPTLHRIAVGRNLELWWHYKGRSML